MPRLLVVFGDTAIGAVALANVPICKLVKLYEERRADPNHSAPHTVIILRTSEDVPSATLCGSAIAPEEVFPEDRYSGLTEAINADPHFFDGINLVVPTSGPSAGSPRLVGLSIEALMASAKTAELALEGPGRWILAMPAHHIVGAIIPLRAAVVETNPQVVDISEGFNPRALLPAIQGVTQDDMSDYLPLVSTQLAQCPGADEEIMGPIRSLASILVGGATTNQQLLVRTTETDPGARLTHGMTETVGDCMYDGKPLPDTLVCAADWDGHTCPAIHSPMPMTCYLDVESPFFDGGGHCWLPTGDLGIIRASGTVEVHGRVDDVIILSGLSIAPGLMRPAVCSFEDVSDAWIMGTPDEKWGHVMTAFVVADQMPPDSLEIAKLGSAIHEHAAVYIGRAQALHRTVAVEFLLYLDFDKIDRAATAQATAEASGTRREWVR